MWKALRAIPGVLQELVHVLGGLAELVGGLLQRFEEGGGLADRLEALERSRSLWEAEMSAAMLKAESTYKATHAAEQRTRAQAKRLERLQAEADESDPFGSEGDESDDELFERLAAQLQQSNGKAGAGEGVPPVHQGMGFRREGYERARSLKWNR